MDIQTALPAASWQEDSWRGWYIHAAVNIYNGLRNALERRPKTTVSIAIFFAVVAAWQRNLVQHVAVTLGIVFGAIVLVAVFVIIGTTVFHFKGKTSLRWKTAGALLGGATAGAMVFAFQWAHDYVSLYYRYITLEGPNLIELTQMPITDHERILPLHGVYSTVRLRMNRTNVAPTMPDLVRIKNDYFWTLALEPSSPGGKLLDSVGGVLQLSASDPAPDLTRSQPDKVHWEFGESVWLGSNINVCVRRAFGPWRFFSYEPGNVFRLKDDSGAWVTVVSLLRWKGIIFPRPEFGGVQVIRENQGNMLSRSFLGCGTWVPPEDVKNHPYLTKQNEVPYEVTRYMAASFRYQAGFTKPISFGDKEGDVKIADLPEDVNQQPFALYFRMPGASEGKLYHYFALQPNSEKQKGLAVSFFYPADGIGQSYVLRHYRHGENPLGVAQVETQLVSNRRQYDWERNRAVEHRPFIRDIADSEGNVARRRFWLSTVVTLAAKREEGKPPPEFEPGAVPEIALTDWDTGEVVWVDPYTPQTWTDEARKKLGEKWTAKRKLGGSS